MTAAAAGRIYFMRRKQERAAQTELHAQRRLRLKNHK